MLRIEVVCCVILALAVSAGAQTYVVESSPVGVTSRNEVKALTGLWDDVPAANDLVVEAIRTRLREDRAFDYWTFVAGRRAVTIQVAITEPALNRVDATLSLGGCNAADGRFEPPTIFATIIPPDEVVAKGWPAPGKGPALVAEGVKTKLLTADNLEKKLWPHLRDCAEVGRLARWHSEARTMPQPMIVLPIEWTPNFESYNCVIRAVAGPSIVYGASLFGQPSLQKVAVQDNTGIVKTGLVAQAQCVYRDGQHKPPGAVPSVFDQQLAPVFVEEKAPGRYRPVNAICTVLEKLQ